MSKETRKALARRTALAVAVAAASTPAMAVTYTVENLNPSGPGSLPQAIVDANANEGADTIRFDVAGTLYLETGLPTITESVTIVGPGRNSLRLDASQVSGNVLDVDLTGGNVSISGLTLRNARYGGIEARYSECSYGYGPIPVPFAVEPGPIYGPPAPDCDTLILRDVALTGNGTEADAALDSVLTAVYDGRILVTGSTISNNFTTEGPSTIAAMYGGSISVEDSTISGNHSTSSGGAAYVAFSGRLTLEDSVVSGNTSRGNGGAINSTYGGTVTAKYTDFTGNEAPEGGAISQRYGTVSTKYSTFSGNEADYAGGAVFVQDATGSFKYTQFSNNKTTYAESLGGAVAVIDGFAAFKYTSVASNRSGFGGGIGATNDSNLDVRSSTMTSNRATYSGGGIFADDWTELDVDDSVISGNIATGTDLFASGGGGIYAQTYELYLDNTLIQNNSTQQRGGGIYAEYSEYVGVFATQITGNTAAQGGGLWMNAGYAEFAYSVISRNSATENGGAFHLVPDEGRIASSTISHNRSSDGAAAELQLYYYDSFTVERSTFNNNVGTGAPAIAFYGEESTSVEVSNSTLSANRGNSYPVALLMKDVASVSVLHSTVVNNVGGLGNQAQLHQTGSYINEGPTSVAIYNSVFASNAVDEVIVGGTDLTAENGYGDPAPVTVTLTGDETVMEQGWSKANTSESTNTVGIPTEVDPGLGLLANNGGFTQTHSPEPDSYVIDKASGFTRVGDDQRGVSTQNGNDDLGAVEYTGNRPPRLALNLPSRLAGVIGREIPPFVLADAFTDPDGDGIIVTDVEGLPSGVFYDWDAGTIQGELEVAGTYQVIIVVRDDTDPSLETVEQFTVRVLETAPVADDDDDDDFLGGTSSAFFGLMAAMGWLRRRKRG